ncbi:MAG: deoxyguanosinetriphosphate triphosphohydrolase, partial [Agathobacter sp.]|nr:deoxyguanosinetriphosphate triphosphohydrolase [Agathobacter sp.]
ECLPEKFIEMHRDGEDLGRVICDFISGMTDQYAITKFSEFYLPEAWQVDGY